MDALYLNAAEIYHAAVEESGLSAYSDPALEERFHYLTGLFNAFGKIPASNYPTAVDQMKSTVIKRLQVARDWKEQPEILDEEIVQPFFVLGSARAGTTFTQLLLTMDDGHRTPRYRDVQHPSHPRGLVPAGSAECTAGTG